MQSMREWRNRRMSIQWVSTTKQGRWNTREIFDTETGSPNLSLTDVTQRRIEGFGGCFNELGLTAMQHLSKKDQTKVYDALFDPEGDCKFTICRLPIGASDYALEWYS